MAAPMVRASTFKLASGSTTCVPDTPIGTASGDLLIALFDATSGTANLGTLTLPSGWTQLRRDDQTAGGLFWSHVIAYKTAGGSEPSTYTFTAPSSAWWRMIVVALAGATAIEANARTYTASTTATEIPCPTVTTLGADRLLMYLAAKFTNGDDGHEPPRSTVGSFKGYLWTELNDIKNVDVSNGSLSVGIKIQPAAGASGTFIVLARTASATTPAVGYSLSISPGAGGSGADATAVGGGISIG